MSAQFQALTPTTCLDRAAEAHGERIAVVDGDQRWTYSQLRERCTRVAGGVAEITDGKPVAVLSTNSHVMLEMHFAAPWAGAPLVALNTRLAVPELSYIVGHSEAALLIYEADFEQAAQAIAAQIPMLTLVCADAGNEAGSEYEQLIATSSPRADLPSDDGNLLALNYTSGTTGRPKGVMYHYRGAYLQAMSQVGHGQLTSSSVFLWTLPMFHCNGWGYPWAVTLAGARHVCLPKVEPEAIWRLIEEEGVTHLNGAPTVLSMIAYSEHARPRPDGATLRICTGGAPPTPTILRRMAELNIEVTHLYGLTETYGPSIVCDWRPEWNSLDADEQARLKARQGVPTSTVTGLRIRDDSGTETPWDADTIGELELRAHTMMLGYFKDDAATTQALSNGWLRTGDLAVRHPDGYVELRDRAKDVIISGGENIASIEVEQAIATHPSVLDVAVVAAPDPRWGEVVVAYVVRRPGQDVTEAEIQEQVRGRIARFKAPKRVVFVDDLPKTATGKVQKFLLRQPASGNRT